MKTRKYKLLIHGVCSSFLQNISNKPPQLSCFTLHPTACILYFSSRILSLLALDSFFPCRPKWMLSPSIPLSLPKGHYCTIILLYSPHFTILAITLVLVALNLYCSWF
ncbi:hypothetical protein V8G54_037248 [Vigna mungo]|uniref:Uncharacterized protein n=1 Tax=Vigna mungo TaxID=3915 RepID=A0AAQ3MI76_VIGMU